MHQFLSHLTSCLSPPAGSGCPSRCVTLVIMNFQNGNLNPRSSEWCQICPGLQHWGPQSSAKGRRLDTGQTLSTLTFWHIWHWLLSRQYESWGQESLGEKGHLSPHPGDWGRLPWSKTSLASDTTNDGAKHLPVSALRIIKTSWTLSPAFWVCQNSQLCSAD